MFDSGGALQMAIDRSVAERADLPTTAAVGSRRLAIAALLSLLAAATLYQGSATVRSSGLRVYSGSSSRKGLSSLPMAAQGTISATLGADDRAYRVSALGSGFQAQSPAQRLDIRFARSGVQIVSGKVELGLSVRAMGYGASPRALDAVTPSANGSRVSYLRAGLSEWYANGPLGLEQGFTIPHAPSGHPTGPLTIAMALSGNAHPSLTSGGQSLTLSHAGGPSLRVAGLTTSDARGRTLDSWFELAPGRLLIHVDVRGAAYPLKVDPFVQQAELTASDGAGEDGLGFSVTVSGNTIVAGAPSHEVGANEKQGAVYVFTMPAAGWANATQSAKLTASDGAEGDELGYSVAASGSTIVAGARFHRVGVNTRQGATYVFTMPAAGWANATQTAELTASDGGRGDQLGYSVAVSGSTIVAGAPFHLVAANTRPGAAYVFAMPASGWANATQTGELTASDGGQGDEMGYSVAASGTTIVAGARSHLVGAITHPGAAYVFAMPASGWANATQTAELTASDGGQGDQLGYSVAVSGSTIVAGARFHLVGANARQGAAYVFTMPTSGWANATQTAELTASDGAKGDQLGYSVAVSGSTIVAGAPLHEVGANSEQGAVYVFTMSAAGWANATQTAELAASDGAEGDQLGHSDAVSGNTIVAGAPLHRVGANAEQGAAYLSTNPPSTLASGSSAILPLPVSRVPPTISRVHQSHSTWRRGGKLAHTSAKKKVPVGTTFSFSLNVPAVISFNFTQRVSGRKVRGKCRAQTKRNRRSPGCKRAVTAGTLSFIGHSGTNKVAFQGRISGSDTLKLGHYTLLISAANSAGHSGPRQLTFTIVK
jgi:hypothetical protein